MTLSLVFFVNVPPNYIPRVAQKDAVFPLTYISVYHYTQHQ